MQTEFHKKHGVVRPPRAYFEGYWGPRSDGSVEAKLTCKDCGGAVNIHFRGINRMDDATTGRYVLRRAEALHECPSVADLLRAKPKRYFEDLFRGNEKRQEQEYKFSKRA